MSLLSVRGLTLRRDDGSGTAIINDLSLDVRDREIIIVRGESGSGKTTLLKCLAELNVYEKGEVLLHGKKACDYGIPIYRTRVQYVPQRPSLLPGTPIELISLLRTFSSRKELTKDMLDTAMSIAADWGIEKTLWMREWSTLSGGEAQRLALAIALGTGGAEILLLDEPTSALDAATTLKVEKTLLGMLRDSSTLKALVWITHEAAQADRIGTRTIDITRRI